MDALTRSRLVSLCVSGFQAPVHVIRVSVERELGANRDAILELASTTCLPVTLKVTATRSARITRITAPARNAGVGGVKNPIATKTPAAMTHPPAAALSLPLTFGRNSRLSAPESQKSLRPRKC